MSSEVKKMLIDAIEKKKKDNLDKYLYLTYYTMENHVEYCKACDEVIELVEGILS